MGLDGARSSRLAETVLGLAASSWRPILGRESPVAGLARLTGEAFDRVVGYCATRCAGPYVAIINRRRRSRVAMILDGHRSSLSNEALLPSAWAKEAAGSLRSRAAIMIGRRSRAPRR